MAVPKSKEDEELPQVPPDPVMFSPAKLLGSLGKLEGTDPGHALESLVESGNWPGRGSAFRGGWSQQGVWWFDHLDLLSSPGFQSSLPELARGLSACFYCFLWFCPCGLVLCLLLCEALLGGCE